MFLRSARQGAQWLISRVLDSRPRGRGFEPHWRHCVVIFEYWFNPGRPVSVKLKDCSWDVKNQIKQTNVRQDVQLIQR